MMTRDVSCKERNCCRKLPCGVTRHTWASVHDTLCRTRACSQHSYAPSLLHAPTQTFPLHSPRLHNQPITAHLHTQWPSCCLPPWRSRRCCSAPARTHAASGR
jgi:hypothetical protein